MTVGYPMTFRRVINRNSLADGDYGIAPERHRAHVTGLDADTVAAVLKAFIAE